MFKKWDILLIIFLIILSFIPEVVFGVILSKSYNRTYAEITLDGKPYKRIALSEHTGEEQMDIKTEHGSNTIKIKDQTIQILDADCPDKICVKSSFISKPGEQIVCLPHKLLIQIKSSNNKNNVDIINAH